MAKYHVRSSHSIALQREEGLSMSNLIFRCFLRISVGDDSAVQTHHLEPTVWRTGGGGRVVFSEQHITQCGTVHSRESDLYIESLNKLSHDTSTRHNPQPTHSPSSHPSPCVLRPASLWLPGSAEEEEKNEKFSPQQMYACTEHKVRGHTWLNILQVHSTHCTTF